MGKLFSFVFGSKPKPSQIDAPKPREPIPGETWYLRAQDGPWAGEHTNAPVKILDVKDGWVRYAMKSVFMDNRLRMGLFLHCYSPEKT